MMNGPRHRISSPITRAGRASGQRGAAVFVVMLVVTLLTGLGIFAVRSASLSTMASGFNRQLTQTHYVADYAVLAMVGELGLNAQVHSTNMTSGGSTQCVGFADLVAADKTPSCAQYGYGELNALAQTYSSQELIQPPTGTYPATVVPGSLGASPLEGDMRIEVTDWHPAWPILPGNDATKGQLGYAMVTVSAIGLVRPNPTGMAAGTWDTASATAAGVESSRAHVVLGPVLMSN